MTITWLGHSCFCIEEEGYRIVLDPYEAMGGYEAIDTAAHEVLCSHDHFDHNYTAGVTLLPARISPFTVRTVDCFHDDCRGAERGKNKIHVLTAGGKTVVHLGDLGHLLSEEQIAAIGPCDVLLIPVGGHYTIDAQQAHAVAAAIAPKTIVPMHYAFGAYGFPVITGVEPFLKQFAKEDVVQLETNTLDLTSAPAAAVTVLRYCP